MSAAVTGETNRTLERLSRPPEDALERFPAYQDAQGRQIDEDCADYVRVAAPVVRAAVAVKGWPTDNHN
eukprot:11263866-Alexandrium_andersonii.AAC.1